MQKMNSPALAHVVGLEEVEDTPNAHVILAHTLCPGRFNAAGIDVCGQDGFAVVGLDHQHVDTDERVFAIGCVGQEHQLVAGIITDLESESTIGVVNHVERSDLPRFTDTPWHQ